MTKGKQLDFSGETIYCGLDVHKTNWKVNIGMEQRELTGFSQDANPLVLSNYFSKNYPGASVKVVYEAGFSGFGIQRSLQALGINCIVVNAADVPSSNKEDKRKDDRVDARKLRRELTKGELKGIYIPNIEMEQARTLVRTRHRLVQDQSRCKNRLWQMMFFNSIKVGDKDQRLSEKSIKQLEELTQTTPALKTAFDLAIKEYRQIRSLVKEATLAIRKLSKEPLFEQVQKCLQSIDGVGLINGMCIQTEIQDINRFKRLNNLCDYAGFVPDLNSSGDKRVVKGVTRRRNEFLRKAIIESSWVLIRKDPAMLMKYNEYTRRMNENKAIIRIGKHLLSRIRTIWKSEKEYVRGTV